MRQYLHTPSRTAWLAAPVASCLYARTAWAGFNEGNWSPDIVGPALMIALCGGVFAPIGYVMGKFGLVRAVQILTALLGLACVALVVALIYFMGDFAAILPMMGLCLAVPALVFFAVSARLGAGHAAMGAGQ